MIEILWRVLPFPSFNSAIDRSEIRTENWVDLADFLTNGSCGVTVAQVRGDLDGIKDGDIVVYDTQLEPVAGDHVLNAEREILVYESGDAFGVVTVVLSPQDSHKRQRQK